MKKQVKKRLRKHGFLARSKTKGGREILARKRVKGRKAYNGSVVYTEKHTIYETITNKE